MRKISLVFKNEALYKMKMVNLMLNCEMLKIGFVDRDNGCLISEKENLMSLIIFGRTSCWRGEK